MSNLKITVLDSETLGNDLDLSSLNNLGDTDIFRFSTSGQAAERIKNADIVIVNKVRLSGDILKNAQKLRLICITATGFDNVDTDYCKSHNIAVCNVSGYSSKSVAMVTVTAAMSLYIHLNEYNEFAKSSGYICSDTPTRVTPVFFEPEGRVWGIMGLGNTGMETARIAAAFGFEIIAYSRTPKDGFNMTDIDTLCRKSDIISVHLPLTAETEKIINRERLSLMKKSAVLVNSARGGVLDEDAVTEAVEIGGIGAFACDVYTKEPYGETHPYNRIKNMDNVCLTPHMAWGAFDARERCRDETVKNITAFLNGEKRNRVV